MKKILIVIAIMILLFFCVPIRKVTVGCSLWDAKVETKWLTAYNAFKQGYLQLPQPDNYWSFRFKTNPPSACV